MGNNSAVNGGAKQFQKYVVEERYGLYGDIEPKERTAVSVLFRGYVSC